MRNLTVLLVVLLAASICAYGQIIDPNVGFCPVGGDCFTATGAGGETIIINSTTGFDMQSNGAQDSNDPWYLLLAVPNNVGGAPSITSASFTQNGTTGDAGQFTQTTSGDIYAFASSLTGGLTGNNSMNAANMFCDGTGIPCGSSNEISAFGSLPDFFEIYVYSFSPGFLGNTQYTFSSGGLAAGSFLAAVAVGGGVKQNIQFSTPYTTTGLITSTSSTTSTTTTTTTTTSGPGGGPASGPQVPEPSGIVLLGSALLGVTAALRKKFARS